VPGLRRGAAAQGVREHRHRVQGQRVLQDRQSGRGQVVFVFVVVFVVFVVLVLGVVVGLVVLVVFVYACSFDVLVFVSILVGLEAVVGRRRLLIRRLWTRPRSGSSAGRAFTGCSTTPVR
jgi:hypothetical protein